jgi:antitoxin component YwqK of YwqJK toxin-antitoxin module
MKTLYNLIQIVGIFILSQGCGKKDGTICENLENDFIGCASYREGHLIEYHTYSSDTSTKWGPAYQFASNGDTLVKAYYKENKLLGSYCEYYSKDRPKLYVYFDSFHEDTMYYRSYNEQGKIVSESSEQNLFRESYYTTPNTLRLNKDSLLELWSIVIVPPRSSFRVNSFLIQVGYENDTIHTINSFYVPDQNDGIYSNMFKLQRYGMYRVYAYSELYDADKNKNLRKNEGYEFTFPLSKINSDSMTGK